MLCTSNGTGLGHLARVMSVGEQLRADIDVVIFTLSAAVSVAVNQGFRTEYLRSREYSGLSGPSWNSLLSQRLEHLAELYRPSVILFDGTHPYLGMCRMLDRHDEIAAVWQRRGMWRHGLGEEAIARSRHFDAIIEPGDYAAASDRGLTANSTGPIERVAPMRYGPPALDRDTARSALGLDGDRPAALVQLGAGQINDVGSMVSNVCASLLEEGSSDVVLAASVLSKVIEPEDDRVKVIRQFPIATYLNAFDFGFFAGGYNSFHEALSLGLPAVFVPNLSTKLDDQASRCHFAAEADLALAWDGVTTSDLASVIEQITSPEVRERLRRRMGELAPADGAAAAAAVVRRLAFERHGPS
jgi:UDP:flavonoid glycosyltransferase YjiC (YdhE family)